MRTDLVQHMATTGRLAANNNGELDLPAGRLAIENEGGESGATPEEMRRATDELEEWAEA